MSKKNAHSRRTFLRAATGAAAAASVAPWVWIPRRAYAAASPAFGAAEHVLVLYAGGGLRSAPLFHADAAFRHNPFGAATGVAAGAQWAPGKILGEQAIPISSFPGVTEIPPVAAIANDIAILAGVDHDPSSAMPATDHGTGDALVTQGTLNADRGLLSIVHREYPGYVNGTTVLPPFDIGLSNFARGVNDFAGYRPISLASADDFTGKSLTGGQEERAPWTRELRRRRDLAFIGHRAPHVQPYLTAAMDAKINSRAYAAALHHPGIDLKGAPDTLLGGATNAQLLDVLGGGPFQGQSQWGLETAFALRLFQLGVPCATVLRYLYDDHSDEKTQLPIDAADLGRQIAGLHFLLHRLTDANGVPLWNKTVVFVVSEFSRDDVDESGFNSAMGSDHQGTTASRNQIWPVFGGPVTAAGRRIGNLDPATLATVGAPATTVRSVLSTMLDLLGIDSQNHFPGHAPIQALFT